MAGDGSGGAPAAAAPPAAAPSPPPPRTPGFSPAPEQQASGGDAPGKQQQQGGQGEQQGGQGCQGEQQDDRLTSISKEMAQHLRHDPPPGMDGCGFVPVSALVEKMEQATDGDEILQVVAQDDKGRYQVMDPPGDGEELRVRAVQGHSVPLENPLHDPIRGPEEVPLALHATSPENWEKIQQAGELRRMSRTHIHFASEPRHLRANDWACVLLQVDLGAAIRQGGIGFCRAANGVVLSEGPIPTRFLHRRKLRDLPESWQHEMPNRERLLEEEAA